MIGAQHRAAVERAAQPIAEAYLRRADRLAQGVSVQALARSIDAGDLAAVDGRLGLVGVGEIVEHLRLAFVAGGADEAASLPAWVRRQLPGVTFDPAHVHAAAWVAAAGASLVDELAGMQRDAVRTVIEAGYLRGDSEHRLARILLGDKERTGLRAGGALGLSGSDARDAEAARAELLGGRFDAYLSRPAREPRLDTLAAPGISRPDVDRMTAAYVARLTERRAATLAQDQAMRAYDAGRQHMLRQLRERGVDPARPMRTWRGANLQDATTPVDFKIAAAMIEHTIELLRLEAGLQRDVIALLDQMEKELIARLAVGTLTEFAGVRLDVLLAETRALIQQSYDSAREEVNPEGIAEVETNFTARMLAREVGVRLAQGVVPENVMRALVGNLLIQGAPSAEWWAQQAADTTFRFANAVRMGVAQGETNRQIVTRVRETMDVSKRNAAALVRTSVQTVASAARRATFEQNSDIVAGVRQVSTLDGRTSTVCIAYSGAAWDMEYKPLPPNKLPYNGGTPRHFSCRSTEVPIIKELVGGLGEFQPDERAAAGGPIAATVTFSQWLETKTAAQQDELLGVGKAQLWREGKITLPQLLNQSGRPLTLAQLRAKYDNSHNGK